MQCALDCFIFYRPEGWKVIWRCGNVREEFVRMQAKLVEAEDFVEFAGELVERGSVEIDESLSPMFYVNDAEKSEVFEEVKMAAKGDLDALGRLAGFAYTFWAKHHSDMVTSMRNIALSASPLDFFLLFAEGGVELMDEVMMRDEIAKVVRPRVYVRSQESQDSNQYLVTEESIVTSPLKAGDQRWAMALAASILEEHGNTIPFSSPISPVEPSPEWANMLQMASIGSVPGLYALVGSVRKAWKAAADMCRMAEDEFPPSVRNYLTSSALLHPGTTYPRIIDLMVQLERTGEVRARLLAGDQKGRYEEWVMGLDKKHETRKEFETEKRSFGKALPAHHDRCVRYATKGLEKRRSMRMLVQASNYWSRVPYFMDRVSLRWGFLKAWHKVSGTFKVSDYLVFAKLEKEIGMLVLEDEISDPVCEMLGLAPSGCDDLNPRKLAGEKATQWQKKNFEEFDYSFRRDKHRRLLQRIGREYYVMMDFTEEGEMDRMQLTRERLERMNCRYQTSAKGWLQLLAEKERDERRKLEQPNKQKVDVVSLVDDEVSLLEDFTMES